MTSTYYNSFNPIFTSGNSEVTYMILSISFYHQNPEREWLAYEVTQEISWLN